MMGRTHAATGALAGLLVGRLMGLQTLPALLPFAAAAAGYALLPDLDHPGATVSRSFGPVTGLLSRLLRACSRLVYRWTKGPRDEDCTGTHRHLSHTVIFAALLGGSCALTTALGGPLAVLPWTAVGFMLAVDQLGKPALFAHLVGLAVWVPAAVSSLSALNTAVVHALEQDAGRMGFAVALGCVVHCLGDALTKSGCPFLWPIPIAGETWYELRPPKLLRFKTGGGVENALVMPAVAVGCFLAIPGSIAFLHAIYDTAFQPQAQ